MQKTIKKRLNNHTVYDTSNKTMKVDSTHIFFVQTIMLSALRT